MPVVIVLVIIAIAVVAFSVRNVIKSGDTGVPAPAKPPMQDEAMRHMREKALQNMRGRGGAPLNSQPTPGGTP